MKSGLDKLSINVTPEREGKTIVRAGSILREIMCPKLEMPLRYVTRGEGPHIIRMFFLWTEFLRGMQGPLFSKKSVLNVLFFRFFYFIFLACVSNFHEAGKPWAFLSYNTFPSIRIPDTCIFPVFSGFLEKKREKTGRKLFDKTYLNPLQLLKHRRFFILSKRLCPPNGSAVLKKVVEGGFGEWIEGAVLFNPLPHLQKIVRLQAG